MFNPSCLTLCRVPWHPPGHNGALSGSPVISRPLHAPARQVIASGNPDFVRNSHEVQAAYLGGH